MHNNSNFRGIVVYGLLHVALLIVGLMMVHYGVSHTRYTAHKLWAPGYEGHGSICALHDWKDDKILPVDANVDPKEVDLSVQDWVPLEGCAQ